VIIIISQWLYGINNKIVSMFILYQISLIKMMCMLD